MIPHNFLKTLRFYSLFSSTLPSQTSRHVVGHPKPSHFPLPNQFLCRHLTSSENPENSTVKYLIKSCGLSRDGAITLSKRFELQSPEKADMVLGFLSNHGLSKNQITKVVRSRLDVLLLDPQKTLLPKVEYFRSLGISREDLAKILAFNPQLLTRSLEKQIIPTYNFLRNLVGSDKNVVSVLRRASRIFVENLSTNVMPNVGLLRALGMPRSYISLLMVHCTAILMVNPEKFGQLMGEVKGMGFSLEKSTSMFALRALCGKSKLTWNRSREIYMRWGWSEDDVLSAFRKHPQCMLLSEKKLIEAMDFFVNKVGLPSRRIAQYPYGLTSSMGKKIVPRCSVVKVLLLKGLMDDDFSLNCVLKPMEKDFLERFVNRYLDKVPQLLSVYQGSVNIEDV